jgi:hypothetical protein
MTQYFSVVLMSFLVLVIVSGVPVAADYPPPFHEAAAEALGVSDWPAPSSEVVGYAFDPAGLTALANATVYRDRMSADFVMLRKSLNSGDYWAQVGYKPIVVRQMLFHTADSKVLGIKIRVFPSAQDVRHHLVDKYAFVSSIISYWNAAGTINDTGDICLLRDARFKLDDNNEWNVDPQWDPTTTRSLYSLLHNVLIEISVSKDSSFQVIPLLQEMTAEIEAQRVAGEGIPELPDVTLDLSSNQVQGADALPGASVSISYSAAWAGANCERRIYVTKRVENHTYNETQEEWEQDPGHPYTYRNLGRSMHTDDPDNPTAVTGLHASTVGHYHVLMVAWGDNLLPKVIYKPLEVTD